MNNNEQHLEDTKYLQWQDGMYVMLNDLKCDYELAVIENSLRDSIYFSQKINLFDVGDEDCIGVDLEFPGVWWSEELDIKLTRAQALYIATGDVNI
jgi:hypothetical protein